jgi:hypothetical protein
MKIKFKRTALALVLGSLGLYGVKDTILKLKVGVDQLRSEINDNTSTEHLIALAKAQLAQAGKKLFEAEVEANRHRDLTKDNENRIKTLTTISKSSRARLVRLQPAIEGKTQFVYAGCKYTQNEVAREGQRLVSKITSIQQELEAERSALKTNLKVVAITTGKLQEAQKRVLAERSSLRVLGVRIKAEEAIAAASASFPDTSEPFKGGYSDSKAALEKRVLKLQRQNASIENTDNGAIVPWGTDQQEGASSDLAESVRVLLGNEMPTASIPKQAITLRSIGGCNH